MKEEKEVEYVNPYDYTYDQDQVVSINANAILSIMTLLEQVIEREPKVGALLKYPSKVEEIKDEKGELIQVQIDWKDHNPNSFFFTAADKGGSVDIMTDVAFKSHQMLFALTEIHKKNINRKIAKKQDDRKAEEIWKA